MISSASSSILALRPDLIGEKVPRCRVCEKGRSFIRLRASGELRYVAPPTLRYARSGGVDIATQCVGDRPDDLVYAWGFVSNLEMMWEDVQCVDFVERLAQFRRLLL